MAAVGGLESETGQLSSRARTPRLDLLIARAASQAHLQRQRGELVLSFQMNHLPSRLKHMAVVGDLLSAKGKMSITALHRYFTALTKSLTHWHPNMD